MTEVITDETMLLIDDRFAERVELANEDGIISDREFEEWCTAAYYDVWLPRTIKFKNRRLDRKKTFLTWHHISADLATVPNFNLTIFRKLGYKIVEPFQYELALIDCPDNLLTETEIVHKYMQVRHTEAYWADDAMKAVLEVMDDHGIVFYKP
jgi:hypothetical protein